MIDYLQRCEPTRQHTQCAGCARRASNAGHEAIDASGTITAKMGCPMYESVQLQKLLKMAPIARALGIK